ncbi:hypothetical protein MJO28_010490, partial [Puccinia striiformis f. sp. tritici]
MNTSCIHWANRNNSSKGIDIFVATHKCNPICGALALELPGNVIVNMPAPSRFVQPVIACSTPKTTVPPHPATAM